MRKLTDAGGKCYYLKQFNRPVIISASSKHQSVLQDNTTQSMEQNTHKNKQEKGMLINHEAIRKSGVKGH